MDIETGLVCLTVVVVSAAVIYLISISTMKEQTYDEAMAELRKKTEEQFSHGRTAKEKLKEKKEKKKAGKKVKEKNGNATEHSETDGGSKGHVAFVEPEVAAVVDEKTTVEEKKKPKKKEKPILLNKNEPSVVIEKQLTTIPVVQNHFEQIHPKDDFELKRSHSREEIKTSSNTVSNVTSVPVAQTKEHNIGQGQKQKQSNKNNNPSVLTNNNVNSASNKQNAERKAEKNQNSQTKQQKGNDKNAPAKSDKVNNNAPVINSNNTNAGVEKKESVPLKSVNVKQQEQVVAATVVPATNSSPAPTPPPVQQQHVEKLTSSPSMKLSKKKKSELAALNQISGDHDGVNVNLLLPLVRKAVLSKSEVQILIDSLLNKQQGISDGSSEWIEGRQDPVVKLKKQLAEKEKALADEVEATTGLQARLKEIRAELNSEKHTVRTLEEAIHARQSEMSSFALKLQHTVEEKQALAQQIQQLQTKLTEEHLLVRKLQEEGGQSQNAFQQELLKQRQQLEMHIARLSETQHQQQETIATLEAQLSNQMQEREALTGELSMLQERSAHLQDSAVQSQDLLIQIETLQSERTNIEQHLQQAQMEATHYLSMTSELKDQLTHVRTENDKLNGLIQSVQNDNSLLRENNDRLTKQVSSAYVEARQLRDENESLAAQVTASMERPATEGRENGDANNYSENKISSHIDNNADNIQKKELLLEELSNQLKAKEIQVENLTSEVNSYKTEISEQQRLANGLREQISKHQKEADRLSNDLTQHKSQVAKLLDQLDSQTLKNNDLRSKNWKVMEALSSTEKLLQNKMNESDKLVAEAVKTATEKALLEQQSSTRQLLQRVFPELVIPECKVQLDWYEQVEKVLRNWKPQQSEEELSSSDLEKQNCQLHAMVVHYKNIIADTEGMLNRLQSHVEQEERKWGEELQALQSQLEAVTRERDTLQAGCSSGSTVDRASNGINHVDTASQTTTSKRKRFTGWLRKRIGLSKNKRKSKKNRHDSV